MFHLVIQEIVEDGTINIYREVEDSVDLSVIEYWENYYSQDRDHYNPSSQNSEATVINVYESPGD